VRTPKMTFLVRIVLSMVVALFAGRGFAVEPGVDVAAPRVAISQVGDSFVFQPANLTIEQGDWVRWKNVSFSMSHTTTSGTPCTSDGLWSAGLAGGTQFTRQFLESPHAFPYFCIPHCGLGMTGQVVVTTQIVLQANNNSGQLVLTWSGGGGVYQIFRSDIPAFTGAGTVTLVPDAGDTGTTFTDTLNPSVGGVLFYLAMNKF